MAHMIDESNARANIAYIGEAPWHGLGAQVQPDQPIEVWAKEAGLAHEVKDAPVLFNHGGGEGIIDSLKQFPERRVLYRSDTLKPLSVVGKDYKIVQPATVLGFFEELCRHNAFTMETAGALSDGKRIWALAKCGDGAPVIGHDEVRPYVLLATSYDGTMATIAKLTSIRVVCHNTLSYAVNAEGERDADAAAAGKATSVVRVSHNEMFDAHSARLDLGIALSSFDTFLIDARRLAKQKVNDAFCTAFLKMLLPPPVVTEKNRDGTKSVKPGNIEDTRGYKAIMGLFRGEAMGAGLPEANGTAWGLLNAVTQYVDHGRGRSASSRLASAWFGDGAALKDKARDQLLAIVS